MKKYFFNIAVGTVIATTFAACNSHPQKGATAAEPAATTDKTTATAAPKMTKTPLQFAFFLESSGSMFGYGGGASSFKTALYDALTRVPEADGAAHSLAFVTDKAYPYKGSLSDFMRAADPFAPVKADKSIKTASSELNDILKNIIATAQTGKVSVLVSDCIYSLDKANTANQLDGLKYSTKTLFQGVSSDLDVLVWQLAGDYNGTYYDYLNGKHPYKGTRPYYMVFIAKRGHINAILFDNKYAALRNTESLRGYKNKAHFTLTNPNTQSFYSVLNATGKQGAFQKDNDASSANYIHGLANCDARARNGSKFGMVVAADLSGIFADENYKTTAANYALQATDNFAIDKIVSLKKATADVQQNDKTYLGTATHLIYMSAAKLSVPKQTLNIQLKSQLPTWISESSTTDDRSLHASPDMTTKTFGLQHLLEGISEAYRPAGATTAYFTLPISIRK